MGDQSICTICLGCGISRVGEAEDLKPGPVVPSGRFGDCPRCDAGKAPHAQTAILQAGYTRTVAKALSY